MPRSTKAIDALEIDIKASANDSSQELNTLITNIEKLANSLNTVDMKTITTDMANFGKSLKGINTKGLSTSMAGLANATIKYRNAIANVNVQNRSANSSFSAFKQGVDNIYSGLNRVNSKINDFAARIRGANKETKNFAQSVGLLYARFFLLIRGIKGLTNQVKSSMDYIEVLNYFDSSFGQVAERGVAKWEEMGYESAEAYYKSFSERAKKVTADMSGFYPEADGSLTALSSVSLGMNPQELLQYQAQFAQMSSSMGTTSEQALRLSEVLTKLGADFASVKNMDFDQVWGDMASGLVGMSRTLDKYGVNIRNANMEMKLHELGINATVASLSQADKALLRTIILLDSSKYAWSDLSETLNTPANQFRMLTNNIKLLGQMIGNILLPIVAKVLPYINAFVIALQRLFTWLAKILGIDLSSLQANNATPDNSALSDMLDDAEGLADALDDDADNAKKLKKQLQGFDALNNLTSKEDSKSGKLDAGLASGLLDDAFMKATDEYLKAWQDAFSKLENDAQRIADRIQTFFVNLTAPIRRAWKLVGEEVKESWKGVFKECKKLGYEFWITFNRVWGNQKTQKIFENIFVTFANIGDIISTLIRKFREAWTTNDNGFKIVSAIRDKYLQITDHIREISESVKTWAENLNLTPLLDSLANFLNKNNELIGELLDIVVDFINQALLPLAKWTLEEGLPSLLDTLAELKDKIDWTKLKNNLSTLWEHLVPFAKRVGEGLILFIEEVEDKLANWINDGGFEKFIDSVGRFLDSVSAQDIANVCDAIAKGFIAVKLALPVVGALKGLTTLTLNLKMLTALKGIGGTASEVSALSGAVSSLSASFTGVEGAGFLKTIGAMNTMDLGTVLGAGTATEIGATFALAFAESVITAIAGFQFGKKIGELMFPNDVEYYRNFSFFGQNGLFQAIDDWLNMMPDKVRGTIETLFPLIQVFESDWRDKVKDFTTSISDEFTKTRDWLVGLSFEDVLNSIINPAKLLTNQATFIGKIHEGFEKIKGTASQSLADFGAIVASKGQGILTTISSFSLKMTSPLSSQQQNFRTVGNNLMVGFSNGLTALMPSISSSVSTFASGLTNKLKSAWKIHSPSRVMDDMGYFFMKGLQNGIEGMYTPIATSLAQFGNELTQAPNVAEEMADIEGNDFNVSSNQSQTFNADNSETNSLLRQQNSLLQQILEKEFGISEGSLFKSVQRSATDYRKMTGNPAF